MTIEATIIADSISPEGIRLTTMQLRYPRMIHSEFMTHRVFGRNASSSRAIPILTLLRNTVRDMAEPVEWGSNNPGMQSKEPLKGFRLWLAKRIWRSAGWVAAGFAWGLNTVGAHKQIANRIVEPWSHISVVVTSTDWANWFALRDHPDADPTIRALAQAMYNAITLSEPQPLDPGEWHLPYITPFTRLDAQAYAEQGGGKPLDYLLKVSAARCARVSYLTHDKREPCMEKDLKLWAQLVESAPVHASPLEHQATPDKLWTRNRWGHPHQHGNLRGWRQHRKMIPNEAVHDG